MKHLIVIIAICAISCTASQRLQHPNLSSLGATAANVNALDDAVIAIQAKVQKFVDQYCGANQTPSCQAAQLAEPVMLSTRAIGNGSVAVGDAFTLYLNAKSAAAQAAAKATLLEKVVTLQAAGLDLTTQSFTVIESDVKTITADIKRLTASVQKGQ